MSSLLPEMVDAILDGENDRVETLVRQALGGKIDPELILSQGLITGMTEVGARFERGDFYIPEMLVAARAMKAGLGVLKLSLPKEAVGHHAKVVIGTITGDLHDIGKNLVGMMLEGAGFEVVDLGTDITPEKFVVAVQEHKPAIVAMSALLTTTMVNMKSVVDLIEQRGMRGKVKIIVGGAPLTEDFARAIGADGYAPDASRAVAVANSLIGGR
jgi:5-methyltetrahydrofolate--homocysteine methyltransferase